MIKLYCPASIGNFGVGFDVLGAAVESPGDVLEAERIESGWEIEIVSGDVPVDPERNTVTLAAKYVVEELRRGGGQTGGIRFRLKKGMPTGSGLGSSAAGAVGGAFAANALYGEKLDSMQILKAATRAEAVVSGAFFADNTAPCLFGGMTIVLSNDPLTVVPLRPPQNMWVVLAMPKIKILTADARAVLPKTLPFTDAVSNLAKVAGVVAAFARDDYSLFEKIDLLDDRLAEPYRRALIPGFAAAKAAAKAAGANGCGISGSGPAVFALAGDPETARNVAETLSTTFDSCPTRVTRIAETGVRLLNA